MTPNLKEAKEGINELKTRELAQKYNIKIAAYGYSKEVEMAKKMQKIIGKETMDELTFIPRYERIVFLRDKLGILNNSQSESFPS